MLLSRYAWFSWTSNVTSNSCISPLNNAMVARNPLTCEDFQQRFNAMWDALFGFWNWPSHVCMLPEKLFYSEGFFSLIPTSFLYTSPWSCVIKNARPSSEQRDIRKLVTGHHVFLCCGKCICDLGATIKSGESCLDY